MLLDIVVHKNSLKYRNKTDYRIFKKNINLKLQACISFMFEACLKSCPKLWIFKIFYD